MNEKTHFERVMPSILAQLTDLAVSIAHFKTKEMEVAFAELMKNELAPPFVLCSPGDHEAIRRAMADAKPGSFTQVPVI